MGTGMNRAMFRIVVFALRGWTWAYTLPLDDVDRETRRREIESDVWEFEAEHGCRATGFRAAVHILLRAFLGVADDLGWAFEHMTPRAPAVRLWTVIRFAVVAIGAATVVVSASGPPLDPARALSVTVEGAGWMQDSKHADSSGAALAPAIAFTLTNIADRATTALEVNAVFHRGALGSAFAPVVGWRGLGPQRSSPAVVLRGHPLYVIDGETARRTAVRLDSVGEARVRLFVHHEGRWASLGDFTIPSRPMPR
jgi:hypothetical protein